MPLTGCKPGYNNLLTHNKAASGRENSKEKTWRRCWTHTGRWVSFLHPWVSWYLCVQLWLESKKKISGGDVYQERGMGSTLQHLAQRGLLLLCMLAISARDKVRSREIRSGPGNETHAKGLKPLNFYLFILKHFTLSCTSLTASPAFIWANGHAPFHHIRSFTCNLQRLHALKLKPSQGLLKVIHG